MAATYFTGAVDGDMTDNGNWTGNAPGAGDVGILDRSTVAIDPSQGNIAAFGTLIIRPGQTGSVGGSGNKLTSSIDTVIHEGVADLWLSDSAGTTADVYLRCASSNVVVQLGGDTMTNITAYRCNLTLDGTLGICALLQIGYVSSLMTDVKCTIVNNGNAVTVCRQWGGNVVCNKEIITYYMNGGFARIPVNTSGDWGTIRQDGGRMENFGVATIDELQVGPGTFDLGVQAKTITKSRLHPQGVLLNRLLDVHTYTAALVDLSDPA